MKKYVLLLMVSLFLFSCTKNNNQFHILIPKPLKLENKKGEFVLSEATGIIADTSFTNLSSYLTTQIDLLSGIKISPGDEKSNAVLIRKIEEQNNLGNEGYILLITRDSVIISANNFGGMFYGIQSFLQLASDNPNIPCGKITDKPRFPWRGFMLDVARQYYPKEVILKLIDALSLYKMNILHLHLSDDQGWRIEIESMPELTKTGAKANPEFKDQSSGFYTKADMREIIQYASSHNITIVPEIDMPGHSRAAITAYPHLSCFGGPGKFNRSNPRDSLPFYDPVCPGKKSTYDFYNTIIAEIAELFPGEYIHIGGDETSKTCWKTCRHCQSTIHKEKLKDVEALQDHFIRKIQKMIQSHGKKAIGWDELYETGAPETFATMAWREEQWGFEAANSNHKVVFAPCQYYYFNYSQIVNNERYYNVSAIINHVYNHDYNPEGLNPGYEKNILGLQACYWGDANENGNPMFEAVFPRIIAFSEKAWSENRNNYPGFLHRLSHHYPILDRIKIPYYIAHPEGLYDDVCFTDQYTVNLTSPIENATMHYTLDESEPGMESPVYTKPFNVPIGTIIKAKALLPNKKCSQTVTGTSKKVDLIPAVDINITNIKPGLKTEIFSGKIATLHNKNSLQKVSDTIMASIAYPSGNLKKDFGLSFNGYIDVPTRGVYSFHLASCDGSNLFLNGDTAVSDDYRHPRLSIVKRVALEKGLHPFRLDYFYSSIFEKHLLLEISGPGLTRQEIPSYMLKH